LALHDTKKTARRYTTANLYKSDNKL
jgi:hypothetical protein